MAAALPDPLGLADAAGLADVLAPDAAGLADELGLAEAAGWPEAGSGPGFSSAKAAEGPGGDAACSQPANKRAAEAIRARA
jgi:hypothetical protein